MTEETILQPAVTVESTVTEIDGKPYYVTRGLYATTSGPNPVKENLLIELAPINPMLLRMAMSAVKLPQRPMYETRTSGGRTEKFPMDEEAAKANPRDQAQWDYYQEQHSEKQGERTDVSMRATFFYGTVFSPPETGWAEEQEMLGITVPPLDKPELRKAHYLMSILTMPDMNGLMRAITRGMGVDETAVEAAEDSFRG